MNSNTSMEYDEFSAGTEEDIAVNGSLVLPLGTQVKGRVVCQQDPENEKRCTISLLFDTIVLPDGRQIPLAADLQTRVGFLPRVEMVRVRRDSKNIDLVARSIRPPNTRVLVSGDWHHHYIERNLQGGVNTVFRVVPIRPFDMVGLIADENHTVDLRAGDVVEIELKKDLQIIPK